METLEHLSLLVGAFLARVFPGDFAAAAAALAAVFFSRLLLLLVFPGLGTGAGLPVLL